MMDREAAERGLQAIEADDGWTPVVHAHWVHDIVPEWEGGESYGSCSNCGEAFYTDSGAIEEDYDYCPHCGARMDERTKL